MKTLGENFLDPLFKVDSIERRDMLSYQCRIKTIMLTLKQVYLPQ